ncbi:MAG: sodium:calcium symporter [Acidobacteria bacterium]|nr:sodium:calcium symporter [Acidobacteriota bacterium]
MGERERWGTRVGLILAMAGNAVGLGNFLRFPVQAAQNGGGAFMIPYFICFLLLGIPMMWVEWSIGRHGGRYGHSSTPGMLQRIWDNPAAKYVGVIGLFLPLIVMTYYTYIESWSLGYTFFTAFGSYWGAPEFEPMVNFLRSYHGYTGLDLTAPGVGDVGISYFSSVAPAYAFFVITLLVNIWILSKGVSGGIEAIAKIAMPALLIFAVILVIRVLTLGTPDGAFPDNNVSAGMGFVWNPVPEALSSSSVWLAAAGQVFFTLSLGMGSIHCYASYLRENDDVALTGLTTAATNEFAEVVLGGTLAIPAAVAYFGLERTQELAQSGFDLAFAVMPTLFQQIPGGQLFGSLWFALLFFAGITSSLAMGQPIMAFLQEEFGLSRKRSAVVLGGIIFLLCQPVILFNQQGFLGEFDFWAGTFGLVLFATIEIILFAWVFGMDNAWAALTDGADMRVPRGYRYIIQYVTPAMLLIILGTWLFGTLPPVLANEPSALYPNGPAPENIPFINAARLSMIGVYVGLCLALTWALKSRKATS